MNLVGDAEKYLPGRTQQCSQSVMWPVFISYTALFLCTFGMLVVGDIAKSCT